MDRKRLLRQFGSFLKPYRGLFLPVLLGLMLESAFYSGVPLSFHFIIDRALLGDDHRLLFYIIGGLCVGAVVVAVAGVARDRLYANITARVMNDIRLRLFDHLQRLAIDFFGRKQAGDILGRFSMDLSAVETAMASAVSWALLPALDVLGATISLFFLDWRLALVAQLVWPVTVAGPRIFAPRAAEESYQRKEEESRVLSFLQENLNAQPVLKAFGLSGHARRGFVSRIAELQTRSIRFRTFSGLVERSSYIGIMFLQVTILGLGAYMVSRKMLSVGSLAAFQALFLTLSYSIANIMQFAPMLVEGIGGLRRIDELLEEPVQVSDTHPGVLPRLAREIRFNNVSFGYDPSRRTLQETTFTVRRGQSVAFVGSSGSGKSTVLNLVMRFYDPLEGSITVDGVDLREGSPDSLRAQMSCVLQESFLFDISIRENIRLGKLGATDDEVEQAAKAAEIHEMILALPQGYDTPVGQRGGRLSGGQRQRVALARAIVRNPEILILDEATSALDPATEAAVNATFRRLGKGRTTLCVTHRFSTVVHADRVFVLDAGRVIEAGSHVELLALGGLYKKLWDKQSGFSLDAETRHVAVTVDRLRQVPIFSELSDELLKVAVTLFETEEHPPERVIIREGDPGNNMYIIVRGKVEVITDFGKEAEKRLKVYQDGDHFGEIAILRSVTRIATIRTLIPCIFLTLTRAHFNFLMERAPELRAKLDAIVDQRTKEPTPPSAAPPPA